MARHARCDSAHRRALRTREAGGYEDLISEAFEAIAADPTQGKPRSAARPGILAYHIAQPGRRARHMLFYRVASNGDVEVVRFLHDAMDFERHLPDDDSDD